MNPNRVLSTVVLILVGGTLCGACSILTPDEEEIRLLNQTESSILFLAWELQSSHLVDLSPSVTVTPDDDRVLSPGSSRALPPSDISGGFEAGDDLRLFLYEVLDGTAEYRSTLTLSAADLRATGHRIRIRKVSP